MNVPLLSNEAATPSSRRIRLALDLDGFRYLAGQAAALAVADCEPTPYSIASAPSDTAHERVIEFLVKVDGASRFGSCVADLRPGTNVRLDGPHGRFTSNEVPDGTALLFVAGGTGIAPLRSMIRELLFREHHGRISLVYSARSPQEFAYLAEWRELANAGRLALTLTLTGEAADWEHARGRTSAMHLSDLIQPDMIAFVCGPPMMVADVRGALTGLGVSPDRIRTEHW